MSYNSCNTLKAIINREIDRREPEEHEQEPRIIYGTPHWDNASYGQPNRITNVEGGGVAFNVRSATGPDGPINLPGSRLVFNDVIPMYTPISNLEELTIHIQNKLNLSYEAVVRLEVVRRIQQGFANYNTFLTKIQLGPREKAVVDVLGLRWGTTRDIEDSSGAVVIPRMTYNYTLNQLDEALSQEILFNYPIDMNARQDYPGIVDEDNPIFPEIFAFSLGEQDANSNTPQHKHYVISKIDWKLAGVQEQSHPIGI